MTRRRIVAWKRLGIGVAASALVLAIFAIVTIAVVSAPTSTDAPEHTRQANDIDPSALGRLAARLEPPADTPSPTPAPTPGPTPQPTPKPAPPPAVTTAVTPLPHRVAQPAAVAPPVAPVPTPASSSGDYRNDIAQALYGLLNNARAENGVAAVSPNGPLIASAEYYVKLHFTTANPYQLNHYLDGGPGDRAWSRGYCCAVGEILVTSEGSPESMVDLWMGSPSHHAVIVDPQYHEIGVSCFGGLYTASDGSTSHPVLCSAEFGAGGG